MVYHLNHSVTRTLSALYPVLLHYPPAGMVNFRNQRNMHRGLPVRWSLANWTTIAKSEYLSNVTHNPALKHWFLFWLFIIILTFMLNYFSVIKKKNYQCCKIEFPQVSNSSHSPYIDTTPLKAALLFITTSKSPNLHQSNISVLKSSMLKKNSF